MIRAAHVADLHIDERKRPNDQAHILDVLCGQISEFKPHVALIAGDLFERQSTPNERNMLSDFIRRLASFSPVVIVRGNHDAQSDLDIFADLASEHDIHIYDRPGVFHVGTPGGKVEIVAIPWIDKAAFVAKLDAAEASSESTKARIEAEIATLFVSLGEQLGTIGTAASFVVAHLNVSGSEASTGQTLTGQGLEVTPGALAELGADYVALGHIHKYQNWNVGGCPVVYAGSPWRQNFGEPEDKGWMAVEVAKHGEERSVRGGFRELPCREIVTIDTTPGEGVASFADRFERATIASGALVRVRVKLGPHDTFDEDQARQILMNRGAHSVKVEIEVQHDERVRSVGMENARTNLERILAYWKSTDTIPEAARAEGVAAKLSQIEGETI